MEQIIKLNHEILFSLQLMVDYTIQVAFKLDSLVEDIDVIVSKEN